MTERPFTQDDYNEIVYALDKAMLSLRNLGKSESEAQSALKDFIDGHYLPVWRRMLPGQCV